MSGTPRNMAWLRAIKTPEIPDLGVRLHEMITDIVMNQNAIAQQTNSSLEGNPAPPPPLQALTVVPSETGVHATINHGGEFYRGAVYHLENSDNAQFTNPFPAYTGPAREIDIPTGSRTLRWRAFASYLNSGNTTAVYHGGATPQPVTGGKNTPLGLSQGSGTGRPGEGIQGFGAVAYRSATGKPPIR